jgi:hypothetical protein
MPEDRPEPPEDPDQRVAAEARIAACARAPETIEARLAELERELTIERVMELNTMAVGLAATGIGLFGKRRWMVAGLPATIASLVLQHAVKGFRPPLPLLRRLGLRTRAEIARERAALEALRAGSRLPPYWTP